MLESQFPTSRSRIRFESPHKHKNHFLRVELASNLCTKHTEWADFASQFQFRKTRNSVFDALLLSTMVAFTIQWILLKTAFQITHAFVVWRLWLCKTRRKCCRGAIIAFLDNTKLNFGFQTKDFASRRKKGREKQFIFVILCVWYFRESRNFNLISISHVF